MAHTQGKGKMGGLPRQNRTPSTLTQPRSGRAQQPVQPTAACTAGVRRHTHLCERHVRLDLVGEQPLQLGHGCGQDVLIRPARQRQCMGPGGYSRLVRPSCACRGRCLHMSTAHARAPTDCSCRLLLVHTARSGPLTCQSSPLLAQTPAPAWTCTPQSAHAHAGQRQSMRRVPEARSNSKRRQMQLCAYMHNQHV